MPTELYKLGIGIVFVYTMPIVAYLVGLVWFRVVGTRKMEPTWRMICLLLPLFGLGMMLLTHFDNIVAVWQQFRALALIIYIVAGILVPCSLICGAIRLWRTAD